MDSFFLNKTDNHAVLICQCGNTECGTIEVFLDEGDKDHDEDPDFAWYMKWSSYMTFRITPYNKNFLDRFRNAWKTFRGTPVRTYIELDATRTKELGEWLVRKVSEVPEERPKLSLKELKEKLKNEEIQEKKVKS